MKGVRFYGYREDSVKSHSLRTLPITCGHCGREAHARLLAGTPQDGSLWVMCECGLPTGIRKDAEGEIMHQWPAPRAFHSGKKWPEEMQKLFDEGAAAHSAGAHTSAAMICRKVLMVAAHEQGAGTDKRFVEYVDYLADEVLSFPQAKGAIDRIRNIGNEANHEVEFVSESDARQALEITHYLLETLYSFPASGSDLDADDES